MPDDQGEEENNSQPKFMLTSYYIKETILKKVYLWIFLDEKDVNIQVHQNKDLVSHHKLLLSHSKALLCMHGVVLGQSHIEMT